MLLNAIFFRLISLSALSIRRFFALSLTNVSSLNTMLPSMGTSAVISESGTSLKGQLTLFSIKILNILTKKKLPFNSSASN